MCSVRKRQSGGKKNTEKIYFDRDLELFILELRKYAQKKQQKENNNNEHHTAYTHLSRAPNEMLFTWNVMESHIERKNK